MNGIHNTPTFNIKAAARETNLKPHTIRAWERRYGLPIPIRTPGGHRLYSPRDIATLKWLKDRQDEGLRINRAVALWQRLESEGKDPLSSDRSSKSSQFTFSFPGVAIDSLWEDWVEACIHFDEKAADQVLNQAFALYPVEIVCLELLIKGLATIGQYWHQGKIIVQQEHFASEQAIRRLESLLAASPQPTIPGHILVICPPEEQHTVSALLITLFLRRAGRDALFLGANVPIHQLDKAIQITKPNLVIITSQQLHTVANMVGVVDYLNEINIPVAYGGRIFNLLPEIRDRIPGWFLGETLDQAIPNVEQILINSPFMPPIEPPSKHYQQTLEHFLSQRLRVETMVLQKMASIGINLDPLDIANINLTNNIIAALTLGDISFLRSDIEWAKELLDHQGILDSVFDNYLRSYATVVADELGDRGSLISTYLSQITDKGS